MGRVTWQGDGAAAGNDLEGERREEREGGRAESDERPRDVHKQKYDVSRDVHVQKHDDLNQRGIAGGREGQRRRADEDELSRVEGQRSGGSLARGTSEWPPGGMEEGKQSV